jgi:hypothetical protein
MTTPPANSKTQPLLLSSAEAGQPVFRSGVAIFQQPASSLGNNQGESTFPAEGKSQVGIMKISGLFSVGEPGLLPARRLIVLVPNLDIDETEMARRIWEIASPPGLAVLFFGICRNTDEEAQMRRRLVTLSALTRDPHINVEIQIEFGSGWMRKLKTMLGAGDILICIAEQQIGFRRKPISDALSRLGVPVWTLTGLSTPRRSSPTGLLAEIVFWLVSIAILTGFLLIQVRISYLPNDWAHNTLLFLSVLIEIGILWIWHIVSL